MAPELTGDEWRQVMAQRVGGFFRNTVRESGRTCLYCTGPSTTETCPRCSGDRAVWGRRLADAVITLTYAQDRHPRGQHQSAYTAYAYKNVPPAESCVQDMQLMVNAATLIHGRCIAALESWWDSVTFVPSTKRDVPAGQQAAAGLARHVRWNNSTSNRLVLEGGPNLHGGSRSVFPDRFVVPAQRLDRVEGKHVLVVDDTWTSGAKIQSAAVTLKDAGAHRVTALCVTRWTRWDWADHEAFLATLNTPYDPLLCPVHGGVCAPTGD